MTWKIAHHKEDWVQSTKEVSVITDETNSKFAPSSNYYFKNINTFCAYIRIMKLLTELCKKNTILKLNICVF